MPTPARLPPRASSADGRRGDLMSESFQDVLAGLADIVGANHVIDSGPDQEPYVVDWRERYRGRAVAVVKPASTAEVAAVVRYCAERRLAIVPQGGNTGMCGGATPDDGAFNVVIRLDRMRRVRDVSQLANTITVAAGCILAEGTLGIVTAAVLKLFAPPRSSALALLKLHDVEQALQIMQRLRGAVGDRLGSLEIMSRSQIEAIAATVPHVPIPFELTTPWYLIVELTDTLTGIDLNEPLAAVLSDAMDAGLAEDAVLASSLAQAKAIWAVRHSVSEGNKRSGYVVSHDSVVPLENQAAFATNVEARINAAVPHARVVMHGHIGDGNIHVVALIDRDRCHDPAATAALVARINEIVDDETAAQGGAISAEHGIGITNRGRLARVADPFDIDLMRGIKRLLDPNGLMNPD